ncbi:hypothetical protein [Streptomyces sp. NPDC002788]
MESRPGNPRPQGAPRWVAMVHRPAGDTVQALVERLVDAAVRRVAQWLAAAAGGEG